MRQTRHPLYGAEPNCGCLANGERKEQPIERLVQGLEDVGGKAANLAWLIEQDEPVPPGWVVGADVPRAGLGAQIEKTLDPDKLYAVRSSANVEDGAAASYAGQFTSELDVRIEEVAAAIERTRASAASERVAVYRDRVSGSAPISVAVLVQEMVSPVVSGVAFSRNPMTGLNEVVIEAVAGRGDRLVGEGITPDRWVLRWGSWVERSDSKLLAEETLSQIAADTARLSAAYGSPIDLEWVWDGEQIWWVQLRPITGLERVPLYSNRISREVMPGIIKPLVWSINVPMVNRAWVQLFTEAIGPNDIDPHDLARAFAYRSYFNMGAIGDIFEILGMPRDSLELLLGLPPGAEQPTFKPTARTMRLLPRLLRLAAEKARYGRSVPGAMASLQRTYRNLALADLQARSDSALLDDVRALSELGIQAAYANIVTPLLANIYNALLRRGFRRTGFDPETVDIGRAPDAVDFDPNRGLEEIAREVAGLTDSEIAEIRAVGPNALPTPARDLFESFLEKFGHLSASGNDFSVAPWRETPEAVLAMVLDHAATHGDAETTDWKTAEQALSAWARPIMRRLRSRTTEFVGLREKVSFTYTYGYGIFRRYFLEIGGRLAERGVLALPDDVMYLTLAEVRDGLLGTALSSELFDLVQARRAEIEEVRDLEMPEIIYGDDFIPVRVDHTAGMLTGIPTSRGHHRGTLRVVRDTEDFGKVGPGDVIAIPYSDVGWTPLFARAGAVVAAAGGMLSHSSIVAREYRIPCVVSVAGAMQLADGATVTVDGYSGSIVVEAD